MAQPDVSCEESPRSEKSSPITPAGATGVANDVLWTALTSGLLLIGNVVTMALLAHRGPETIFAPYNLARRLAVGLMPVLCVGMNLGLVRYLPGRVVRDRNRLVRAALGVFLAVLAVGTAVIAILRPTISANMPLLRSTSTYWAAWINIVATATMAMLYALFRGEIMQRRANLLNLLSITVVPLVVVILAPAASSVALLLSWTGVGTLCAALACSATYLRRVFRRDVGPSTSETPGSDVRPLLAFSWPRVPALVAAGLMMVIGPWVAAATGGVGDASRLFAGFAFAQGVCTAVGALGLVLMPRIAQLKAVGLEDSSARLIEKALHANLLVAAVATPFLVLQSRSLVQVWLGAELAAGDMAVQWVLLGVPGILAYSLLAAVCDGSMSKPVTTLASFVGLVVCLAGSLFLRGSATGLAFAFSVGETLSASVLFVAVSRQYRVSVHATRLLGWVAFSTAVGFAIVQIARVARLGTGTELGLSVVAGLTLTFVAVWWAPVEMGFRATLTRFGGGRGAQ